MAACVRKMVNLVKIVMAALLNYIVEDQFAEDSEVWISILFVIGVEVDVNSLIISLGVDSMFPCYQMLVVRLNRASRAQSFLPTVVRHALQKVKTFSFTSVSTKNSYSKS